MSEQKIQDPTTLPVKRALLSVSDKTGLVDLAKALNRMGVEILSTGGTARALKEVDIPVKDVSDETGFPEIMDGRVKTLHPKIHGGLLARRNDEGHIQAMDENGIEGIDLLVVNLYPFSETIENTDDYKEAVENIDIGGPAMIRAAAKNHEFVAVVTDPDDYEDVLDELKEKEGRLSYKLRQRLAATAFGITATYDSIIAQWFSREMEQTHYHRRVSFSGTLSKELRYGENPHQSAALYLDNTKRPGVATANQLQGKELSYNNLNDTDAAYELVSEFEQPAAAIIKHANPCGVAVADNTVNAYKRAFACDPTSAFGGIIALNKTLDEETAKAIIEIFCEVIIAPSVSASALEVLKDKKNLRVLTTGTLPKPGEARQMIKTIAGGMLVQSGDNGLITQDELDIVTDREPTDKELEDLLFAFSVCKHVKSNAIVYAKGMRTVGIGAGQMSRVDSTRIAVQKSLDAAKAAGQVDALTRGSVVASDAFFPFADGLIVAAEAGATAVIQPGGSKRDQEVINAANERGLAMAFTGMRHFRH